MVTNRFRALVLREIDAKTQAAVETLSVSDLPAGDTLVKIDFSTLNFKDALAITGRGKIVKTWPMVPGIDFAGTVVESGNPVFKPGAPVILTGWGVGEKYWGGFSQYQRVQSEWLVPLPSGLTTRQAMIVGTAGLTAMLCIEGLEKTGMRPNGGPVLVTGASGGVGSVAVAVLAHLGYHVVALTHGPGKQNYVRSLGATEFADGAEWEAVPRPLERQRWAAAIDTVGSKVLARVLAEMDYGGSVAACGLAGGADLNTTVMPFILRKVSLLGIDSVMLPTADRIDAWRRISNDLPKNRLEQIVASTASLAELAEVAKKMLDGGLSGRVVIDVNADG